MAMIIRRITAQNWRNFRRLEVPLEERMFAIGPNAGGKSNFLDLFRFLSDLVRSGGGLFRAVEERGGIESLRCRSGGKGPDFEISVELGERGGGEPAWRYELGVQRRGRKDLRPVLVYERVHRGRENVLDRPDADDRRDPVRLEQTFLENVTTNEAFRAVARFFHDISYRHLYPQSARREAQRGGGALAGRPTDESLRSFLEEVTAASPAVRAGHFQKMEAALRLAVPQFERLSFSGVEHGRLRVEGVFEKWRQGGPLPQEYFSDGTLRLISILWALLETKTVLLLEEPELSLHPAVARHLAGLIYRLKRRRPGQIIVTTHSAELLSDPGIDGREVLLFLPAARGGADVRVVADLPEVKALIDAGLSIGEIALPRSQPARIEELGFFP